jgi:hypothetical protein
MVNGATDSECITHSICAWKVELVSKIEALRGKSRLQKGFVNIPQRAWIVATVQKW